MADRAQEIAERWLVSASEAQALAHEIRQLLSGVLAQAQAVDPEGLMTTEAVRTLFDLSEPTFYRGLLKRPDFPPRYNVAKGWGGQRPVWRYSRPEVIAFRDRYLAEVGPERVTAEESARYRAIREGRSPSSVPQQPPAEPPTATSPPETVTPTPAPERPPRARESRSARPRQRTYHGFPCE